MPSKSELSDLIGAAAIVLLHREIRAHGKVVLTPKDFVLEEEATRNNQEIVLETNGTGDVIFTHGKRDAGRSVD
jgi:hypothetical protein